MVETDLHTLTGLKRRRCKGLEPSRRLSETTGPRHLSAFRVVVRGIEVTKRVSWRKSLAAFITHGAPRPGAFLRRIRAGAHVPPGGGAPRTCSRSARADGEGDAVHGDRSPFTRYLKRSRGRGARYRGVNRAEHAAGRVDGSARTGADSSADTTADGGADAGDRRSRHRRWTKCGGEVRVATLDASSVLFMVSPLAAGSYTGAVRGCGSGCRVAGQRATVGRESAVVSRAVRIRGVATSQAAGLDGPKPGAWRPHGGEDAPADRDGTARRPGVAQDGALRAVRRAPAPLRLAAEGGAGGFAHPGAGARAAGGRDRAVRAGVEAPLRAGDAKPGDTLAVAWAAGHGIASGNRDRRSGPTFLWHSAMNCGLWSRLRNSG